MGDLGMDARVTGSRSTGTLPRLIEDWVAIAITAQHSLTIAPTASSRR
jgi:hypothetical protein